MKYIFVRPVCLVSGLFFLLLGSTALLADEVDVIHMSVISAPVVANGMLASEPTEFNILVSGKKSGRKTGLDGGGHGLQIPAGGRMEVELGGAYIANPDFSGFLPGRNIILTTGPQNPIKPNTETVSGGNWTVSSPAANTVVVIPRGGKGKNGLEGTRAKALGFKVVHIRPDTKNRSHSGTPFYNGPVGSVGVIYIRIYDDHKLRAAGSVSVIFPANVGMQANLSNLNTRDDNSINSNTNFQRVKKNVKLLATGLPASGSFTDGGPYAPQFLLFDDFGTHDANQYPTGSDFAETGDASFIPFPGISGLTLQNTGQGNVAYLMQDGVQVGTVVLTGPAYEEDGKKNSGFHIIDGAATVTPKGNGTLLFVPVKVGRAEGVYRVTVQMLGGGSAVNTIIVH